jgi:sarcosine oxidase subunit beta
MANGYDVLIVGAGNLGMWTAYGLAQRGVRRIAVCERQWAGFGATTRSAGIVRAQGGSETAIKLGHRSQALYEQLGAELGLDSGFTRVGYYLPAESAEQAAVFQELAALRRSCGVRNDWLDAAECRRRFPALDWEGFLGATYSPDDGYVHPPIVARNIAHALLRSGAVDLFELCPVTAIAAAPGGGYRVTTARGGFEAERVVNAGGPRGAREVGAMVGVDAPVNASRHLVVTFATVGAGLQPPFPMFFLLNQGYYVRPEEQGALLGLSNPAEQADESGRYQLDFDWDYFESMRPHWGRVCPALAGARVARAWAGSIDYTPDHLPIVDQPLPGFFVLAAGGHGMMWGPALGLAMAELMTDGRVADLPRAEIELARFARGDKPRDAIALPFPTR